MPQGMLCVGMDPATHTSGEQCGTSDLGTDDGMVLASVDRGTEDCPTIFHLW